MRDVKPVEKPLFTRDDEADLKRIQEYPLNPTEPREFFPGIPEAGGGSRKDRQIFGGGTGAGCDYSQPGWQK